MFPAGVAMLLSFGDAEAAAEAQRLFTEGGVGGEGIPSDLYGAVLTTVVRRGGVAEFEAVGALMGSSSLAERKCAIQAALTASRDPVLLKRALAMAFGAEVISPLLVLPT
jgi:hypothetical protein